MKHCPACKTDKPEEAFYLEPKRADGLSSNCKECKNQRNRDNWRERYYPAHREGHIASVLRRKKAKPKRNSNE